MIHTRAKGLQHRTFIQNRTADPEKGQRQVRFSISGG